MSEFTQSIAPTSPLLSIESIVAWHEEHIMDAMARVQKAETDAARARGEVAAHRAAIEDLARRIQESQQADAVQTPEE